MVNLKTLFKNKKSVPKERKPINLPELPADKMNVADISKIINEGVPIWTWTSILDKCNVTAMFNMANGCLDGFACFRKEDDLIYKYIGVLDSDKTLILKMSEICKCSNSNIMELINTEFTDAYKVYYDDEGITDNVQFFRVNLVYEDIKDYLENHRVMSVTDEHFVRKDEANLAPEF